MRARRLSGTLSSRQLVSVQSGVQSVSAAKELLEKYVAEVHMSYSSHHHGLMPTSPISVYLDGPHDEPSSTLVVEFELPKTADVTAVLASALSVNSLTASRSSPLRRSLFGEVTLGDRMENAAYELEDDEHRTIVKTDSQVVVLSRSLSSPAASLRLSVDQALGATQALALARAYYLAHHEALSMPAQDSAQASFEESDCEFAVNA